jgi:phage gpG-like protein
MSVEITGADEAIAMLDGVAERARDMQPMLDVLRSEIEAMARASVASQTSPDGTPWAPRQAAYRWRNGREARPRKDARQGRPLLEYVAGEMRITYGGGSFTIELPEAFASYHQFGARDLPAREVLPIDRGGPMTTGVAGAWWEALPERLAEYVATGEVT